MQRRDFIKYSALSGTGMMFPSLVEANWTFKDTKKAVEIAFYASKLNPVRLISGLIFDRIAEVYVEPLAKQALNSFFSGKKVSASSLSYYGHHASEVTSSTIYHEPYKASVAVYGKTDYEIEKERKVRLELIASMDKKRFADIIQYLKDEKIEIKLYDNIILSTVGDDLTPNELFNIDYIKYGKQPKERYVKELLSITNNRAFSEVVV